jgi:hypothetical protein
LRDTDNEFGEKAYGLGNRLLTANRELKDMGDGLKVTDSGSEWIDRC